MKRSYLIIFFLVILPPLVVIILLVTSHPSLDATQSNGGADYSKIFAGENWENGGAFLNWAKPLPMVTIGKRKKCSEETKRRIADSTDSILSCDQVATLRLEDPIEQAIFIWATLKRPAVSTSTDDCTAGLIYLDKKQKIAEDSPAACGRILEFEEPTDIPVKVFRVVQTEEIGVVVDWQGYECAGSSVLKQQGPFFKKIYEFDDWSCSH